MDSSSDRTPDRPRDLPCFPTHGGNHPEDDKSGLAALILDALPHPAMLIRPDRTIVLANRTALKVGARVGEPCWKSFGQSEFIPEDDRHYINAHAGSLPPGGTKCSFCRCDEAMADMAPHKEPAVEAFGKLWDTFWVPLAPDLYLHYAVDVTAPERMRREAEELQQRLHRIVQAAPVGIGMVRERILEWVSHPLARMLGYMPEELEGKNARILYQDDAEFQRVAAVKFPQIEKTGVGEVETRLCRKDGSRMDILLRSVAFDQSDFSRGMIFTALDISKRKEAARLLEEKERYYRTLINSLQEDVIVIDRDLRITDLNNGSLKTSGHQRDEIIGQPCYTMLHGADRPCRELGRPCGHEAALNGQVVRQQHQHIRRDGSVLWADVLFSPIKDDKGRITHVVESVRDVTSFVKQQEQLQHQNILLDALYETVLDITKHRHLSSLLEAIVQRAALLADVPNAFLHLYNPRRKVLETKAARGVYRDMVGYCIKPGQGLSGTVFEKGRTMYIEDYQRWPRRLPDDRFASVNAIAAVPLKLENEVVGVLGLSHNVPGRIISETVVLPVLERFAGLAMVAISNARLTRRLQDELHRRQRLEKERQKVEAYLRQAQKMEAIGTLAGGIAHDFNNILSAVIGFSELSMDDARPGTRLRANLEEILQAGLRARDLVRQILTFSRQSETEKVPLQVNLVVKEALKLLRASLPSYIEIHEELACEAMVVADATNIHQVVMNLCTNAFHAMGESDGVMEIALRTVTIDADRAVHMALPSAGNYLQLKISDTGCGMAPELQQRIFDPYFTTKEKGLGTGLGLAMVRGIVADCGGAITVESQPGRGSTFAVYLPLVKRHKIPSMIAAPDLPTGSGQILFVDDEPAMGVICRQMLEKLGYTVTTRTSSLEALELLRAQPQRFDLVITDQTMPHLSGDGLARELATICPQLPIILCTGYSEKLSEKSARQLGVREILMKPLVRVDLARACARVLKDTESG